MTSLNILSISQLISKKWWSEIVQVTQRVFFKLFYHEVAFLYINRKKKGFSILLDFFSWFPRSDKVKLYLCKSPTKCRESLSICFVIRWARSFSTPTIRSSQKIIWDLKKKNPRLFRVSSNAESQRNLRFGKYDAARTSRAGVRGRCTGGSCAGDCFLRVHCAVGQQARLTDVCRGFSKDHRD